MVRSLRGLLQSLFSCLLVFFICGCEEYNRIPTVSEQPALTKITQVTGGFTGAGEASFSHDMRWIVFRAVAAGQQQFQVFVARVLPSDGASLSIDRPISVTPPGTRSGSGCFSPDAGSLIFASTAPQAARGRFPHNMQLFRVDGWEEMVAMLQNSRALNLAQNPLTTQVPYNGECAYSPDGRFIVFTSGRGGDPDLYLMHADGTHVIQLTRTKGYDGSASFSPNGKMLLYQSERTDDHARHIYTAELTFDRSGEITGLKNERALTHEDDNVNPCWHPDGQHIAYATSRNGVKNFELYLMDRSGHEKTRLTLFPGADLFPAFSPDGKYLMWTSRRSPDGTTQVFEALFQFPKGT